MTLVTRHLLISGRVQGVWYRNWTIETAQALGCTGWVRNLGDDRVEVVATGSPRAIDALTDRCWSGPPEARVSGVEASDLALQTFGSFSRRPSA